MINNGAKRVDKPIKKKKGRRKKKQPVMKRVIQIVTPIIVLLFISIVFALFNLGNSDIIDGISINGISVSGLTKTQAKNKLLEEINDRSLNGIPVAYKEETYAVKLEELEFNIDEAVSKAYKIGRSGNIVKDNYTIIIKYFLNENIDMTYTYDQTSLTKQAEYLQLQLPDRYIENQYYREGNSLILTKGQTGALVDTVKLKNMLDESLADFSINTLETDLPTTIKQIEEISIEDIHKEIYQKAENAYYTEDPFEIHTETEGVDFAISNEEIEKMLLEEKESYTIPLKITKPKTTVDNLDINVFPDLIGQYDTRYDVTFENKANNINIAVKKINGVVLKPGETFSYNKTLGVRTIENGYKEAPIYSEGKIINGLGGGICQVSSTLYNAALLANLEIVERENHMFVPNYVTAGRDATVVYGSIDFKFKNNRKYPIKITATAKSGIVRVSINSIAQETDYIVEIATEIVEILPYETIYVTNSNLKKGEENIIQKGENGQVVETYKILKRGDILISKTLLNKDTYRSMQETIEKG